MFCHLCGGTVGSTDKFCAKCGANLARHTADECSLTYAEILFFSTGVKEVPPLGFKPKPSLGFLHSAADQYPTASTCTCCLRLPVAHQCYETFKEALVFGITNCQGFGCA